MNPQNALILAAVILAAFIIWQMYVNNPKTVTVQQPIIEQGPPIVQERRPIFFILNRGFNNENGGTMNGDGEMMMM